MSMERILARLTAVATWPASRFAGLQRTYDLTLSASEVVALVEAGVAVDPLLRPIGEALRSPRREIVGRVVGQRFEIYISGRSASGIGLVGTVEEQPTGSRVITKVAWAGPTKWFAPAFTVVVLSIVVGVAVRVALLDPGVDAWPSIALCTLIVGVHLASMISRARKAQNNELPILFERLDAMLARHTR